MKTFRLLSNYLIIAMLFLSFGCKRILTGYRVLANGGDVDCNTIDSEKDPQGYQDCLQNSGMFDTDDSSKPIHMPHPIDEAAGQPLILMSGEISAGYCLTIDKKNYNDKNKYVEMSPCAQSDNLAKWHLISLPVKYKLDGVEHSDLAFSIVSRRSIKHWSLTIPGESADLECLEVISKDQKLWPVLKGCHESNLMFLTVPNRMRGDENLQPTHSLYLFALDVNDPRFATLKAARAKQHPFLVRSPTDKEFWSKEFPMQVSVANQDPQNPKPQPPVNLGDLLSSIKGLSYLSFYRSIQETEGDEFYLKPLETNNSNKLFKDFEGNIGSSFILGKCSTHKINTESECFIPASKNSHPSPFASYKTYYQYRIDETFGPVIQLRQGGDFSECILWGKNAAKKCDRFDNIDQANGDVSSQFRMQPYDSSDPRSQRFRLTRVTPSDWAQGWFQCYDLKNRSAAKACTDPVKDPTGFDISVEIDETGEFIKDPIDPKKKYRIQYCQNASSTKDNLAYDCVDYISENLRRLKKASDIISYIPIFGDLPSIVLTGMLCASGEAAYQGECMSTLLTIGFDVLFLPLDLSAGRELVGEIALRAAQNKGVKFNFNLITNLLTDPFITVGAVAVGKRFGRNIAKEATAKGLTGEALTQYINKELEKRFYKAVEDSAQGSDPKRVYRMDQAGDVINSLGSAIVF